MTATKIQPGDDTHLTLLMAPHSLNFVTGADRAALLAYGRDVFAAALKHPSAAALETLRDFAEGRIGHTYAGSCPDHFEGHDSRDPECLVCQALDAVGGAAPAAVAPQDVVAWMTPEGDRVVTAETMDGARKDGGASLSSLRPYTVALIRGAVAPALEAPAAASKCAQCKKAYKPGVASVGCPKCAPGVQISEVDFQKPPAAAPQAPAAPAVDAREPIKPQHPQGMTSVNARLSFNHGWTAAERAHGIRPAIEPAAQAKEGGA